MAGAAPDPEECPICSNPLHDNTPLYTAHVARSSTGGAGIPHTFHRRCIADWVNPAIEAGRLPSCPICHNQDDVIRNLLRIDPSLLPVIRIVFNGLIIVLSDQVLVNLLNAHNAYFAAQAPLPMYPHGVPPGELVPAGWAEHVIPAPAPAVGMIQSDLWNNTLYLTAIIAFMILFNFIIMDRLRSMSMSMRKLGGGPTNTKNQLCINKTCYEVDTEMVPLITNAISALQKYVNSVTPTKGGTRRTYRKFKKYSTKRHIRR